MGITGAEGPATLFNKERQPSTRALPAFVRNLTLSGYSPEDVYWSALDAYESWFTPRFHSGLHSERLSRKIN